MDSIIIIDNFDTGYFTDATAGLGWMGDDARHYDPLDRNTDLEGPFEDEDVDALIDEGDDPGVHTLCDRWPYE